MGFWGSLDGSGIWGPMHKVRERLLASEGGPQLTASKETSVLQLQGSELDQRSQGAWK